MTNPIYYICEHCFQRTPCGCMAPSPTPICPGNTTLNTVNAIPVLGIARIRRLSRVTRTILVALRRITAGVIPLSLRWSLRNRSFLCAVLITAGFFHFTSGAAVLSGAEFDSLTSPAERQFVRTCYLAIGGSLHGDETVSGMLTVLSIGQWKLLDAEQLAGIRKVIFNVNRRGMVLKSLRSRR